MTILEENELQELVNLWSQIESGLGVLLGNPREVQEFEQRVWQYDRWLQTLLAREPDLALYLLFQLVTHSAQGYSTAHALVCATLSHLLAEALKLPKSERDSLVHAALTMNLAMTALQDQLALQAEPLSPAQSEAVRQHAVQGGELLAHGLDVRDNLWVEIVSAHHDAYTEKKALAQLSPLKRLVRILQMVDRYVAMISPRLTRAGRSSSESARNIITGVYAYNNEAGRVLIRTLGLCPPGTYVSLEDDTLAVVVRRTAHPNRPLLAVLSDARGRPLSLPRLHRLGDGPPGIQAALTAAAVQLRPNHLQILQLGRQAAQPG